jgi:outer membrane protein OmpA-like peptidoglycan-associated protein
MTVSRTSLLARAALALAALALASPATAQNLSTSVLRPTPVDPATGMVAGDFPGGSGAASYYLAVDLKAGSLITQLQVTGRPHTPKRIDFELLDANARVAASAFLMAESEAKRDLTKAYAIDSAGRYVIRLIVDGKETNAFCVLMGGTALPEARSPGCPVKAAAMPAPLRAEPAPVAPLPALVVVAAPPAPPPPPAVQAVEVIVSKCEERLRVGADFLFDFDRAELRSEADAALAQVAARISTAKKAVLIEGHTDAKGTESYNQTLSERRAGAVRVALVGRGLPGEWLRIRGYGKSYPVASNQYADGSDDPHGRQKNRRVEVVINTCS